MEVLEVDISYARGRYIRMAIDYGGGRGRYIRMPIDW